MRKGNKLKSLGRPRDQRISMLRNLARSLILSEEIVTTQSRGKAVSAYFDKLMTTAKKDTESSRRFLVAELGSEDIVKKLTNILVKRFEGKTSGYCSRYLLEKRSGDNAQLMKVQLTSNA